MQSVEAAGPNHERVSRVRERGVLAGKLRDGVDAPRPREVVLSIRLGCRSVEHVVGAHVDQLRAALGAALGEPLHGAGVHLEGPVLLALADVEVVEGGAVEDDLRLGTIEGRLQRGVVGDVELVVRRRMEPDGAGREQLLQVGAELPPRARDQGAREPHG